MQRLSKSALAARIVLLGTAVFALNACSLPRLPRLHKVVIQQGNVVTQEMIDKLKPGMTREQVAFVMGQPVMQNTFNNDRWDFVYSLEVPGVLRQTAIVTLYFETEVLAYFTGDLAPSEFYPTQAVPGEQEVPDGQDEAEVSDAAD